ncbi:MAG: DNA polymerase III subunit delta' [Rhodobacteraceae bacterium]|nr:DNA polymerase III subunit delta' [Paracoccaceae bacterium]
MSEEFEDRPNDPDRLEGVSHPRETLALRGQSAAESAFLAAWRAGRPHHAWLLRGPPGIGKATMAYRIARFLLTRPPEGEAGLFGEAAPPPETLDTPEDDPAIRQLIVGAHPQVVELRRPWNEKTKTFRTAISVETVRRLIEFFQLSSADGGWRVALVDPADELNAAAANALLKLIEEPPARAMFLLVSHAPGRLPATIRSRCRRLDFNLLPQEEAMAAISAAAPELSVEEARALSRLAPGSPGAALRLGALDGVALYAELSDLMAGAPRLDRRKLTGMMGKVGRREGAQRFEALGLLLRLFCERMARAGALGAAPVEAVPGEAALAARLAPDLPAGRIWAETAAEVASRFDAAVGLNLDPQRSILDIALYIEAQAQRILRRAA